MKKHCCWLYDKWFIIQKQILVVLGSSNYATKKLDHPAGVDTSDSDTKKDFIALKAEVWQIRNQQIG